MSRFTFFLATFVFGHVLNAAEPSFAVISPGSVYAGNDLWIDLRPPTAVTPSGHWYIDRISLAGAASAFTAYCTAGECSKQAGRYYEWDGDHIVTLRVPIAASLSPGIYKLSVTSEYRTHRIVTDIPIQVLSLPTRLSASSVDITTVPDVPNVAKWKTTMMTLGRKWCRPGETMQFGYEGSVWYYDGGRVYFQMADYTGDATWNDCALHILRQYRDFVFEDRGTLKSWRIFTAGLRLAYLRTGDESFRDAVVLISRNAEAINNYTGVDDSYIREVAYAANAFMDAEKLGEPRNANLERCIDFLLGHFNRLFVHGTYTIHQTFFDGLAAETLISYYEMTGDPRIPAAVKIMLDWLWEKGWDSSRNRLIYNPDPPGGRCETYCQVYTTESINLIVPAFAWYWSVTGDTVYQQRGDTLFAHALDTDISYSGKIFSQNFRWSGDYLRWRSGGKYNESVCTYKIDTPWASVGPAGGVLAVNVSTGPSCSWAVQNAISWAPVTGLATGSGPRQLLFSVDPHMGGSSRTAEMMIGGVSVRLVQQSKCTFALPPDRFSIAAAGGEVSVNVTTQSGCVWTATTDSSFAVPTVATGSGTGPLKVRVDPNTTNVARYIRIAVPGQWVWLTQLAPCTYQVSPTSATVSASGGSVSVQVTAGATCSWATTSTQGVSSTPSQGSGSKTVVVSVPQNSSANARALEVRIGNAILAISQAGAVVIPAPTAKGITSVSPTSGNGSSQSFTFTWSDPDNISLGHVLINTELNGIRSCLFTYFQASNRLALLNDAGTVYEHVIPGTNASVQNSQCGFNGSTAIVSRTANQLTMTVTLTFAPSFTGSKTIYMLSVDKQGTGSGWASKGSWTVNPGLSSNSGVFQSSLSPRTGVAVSQVFHAEARGRSAPVTVLHLLFNSILDGRAACFVTYFSNNNQLGLLNDAGTAYTLVTPGARVAVRNSQCLLNAASSSVSISGTVTAMSIHLVAASRLSGMQTVFMNAMDSAGASSGWQSVGSWNPPNAPSRPVADLVTPATGSGSTQTFTFSFLDPEGSGKISFASALISPALYGVNACFVTYFPAINAIGLLNDSGTSYTLVTPGMSTTTSNSQCSISGANSQAWISAAGVTFSTSVTFSNTFTGSKNIYLYTSRADGVNSDWQEKGVWNNP